MKLAVVLCNLGGPDDLNAVEPFLRNLFSDPAIIALPGPLRWPLARFIAARRAPVAREIYRKLGGRSPILEQTEVQAYALEDVLRTKGHDARVFIAMRCWKPFSGETARAVAAFDPDQTILLPLYPQYSTTTTESSLKDWRLSAMTAGVLSPQDDICCFFRDEGFVSAQARLIREVLERRKPNLRYRLLLSAHGLPKRVIAKGDPYQWQVEQSAAAIVERLGITDLDWTVSYQSRVGPLEWIGPATDAEVRRAGAEGLGLVVAPIAFVSEHSETLVELDIEYAQLAAQCGVADYLRVPTVGCAAEFIEGLATLVLAAVRKEKPPRACPADLICCGRNGR